MKKFTFLFTMLLLALVGSAATVTDVLTAGGLGLTKANTYVKVEETPFESGAVYAGFATLSDAAHGGTLQIKSGSNSIGDETLYYGIATTASGGTVKKVTVAWQSGTATGRTLNVYGSNSAFNITTAYSSQGTLIGSIVKGTSTELAITDSYQYIAFASKQSAMYIESISIEWETSGEPVTPTCSAPQFSLAAGTYSGFVGDKKEIALTCNTEGAKIYYAVYDATTTDPSTITDFTEYTTTTPIEITCAGEYSIAAYATCEGYNDSGLTKGTWKYEAYATVGSIAEFIAAEPATSTVFDCPLYVTACVGKYLFVRDEAGDAILVFGTIPTEYECKNGTQFEARSIEGTYALYNNCTIEVEKPTFLKAPLSEPATEKTQPVEVALEDVTADIQSKYVTIKCAKFNTTDKTLELGSASVAYFAGRFGFTVPENVDAYYSVTGVVEMYNNSVQVSPISCAEYKDESPEQVYIVGEVSDEAGNYYGWAPNKGLALTKVYPGGYNGKVVIEHGKYYAVFTALGANENDWDGLNANKYGLSYELHSKIDTELALEKGCQMRNFWAGTYDVTVDLNKMTILYGSEDALPDQLRIIGDLRMPNTFEEVSWNTEVNDAFIADNEGGSGKYIFKNIVVSRYEEDGNNNVIHSAEFMFTAAVNATEWDNDNNINDWGIKAAVETENVLEELGTVAIAPWTSKNVMANVGDYDYASYNLVVDLVAQTVTSTGFTGTEKIEIKGANVEVSGGTIIVSGAASIYNAAGQAIAINSKAGKFNVPAGLYFVRVDGKVTKVLVR